jgi:hypothetical protein
MELPSRSELTTDLESLQRIAESLDDEAAPWIAIEVGLGRVALHRADSAERVGDRLGAFLYLRILAEVALRVRWLAGDRDEEDDAGFPIVDALLVRERVKGLRRRDLLHMAGSFKVIAEFAGGDKALHSELLRLAATLEAPPAPDTWRGLATSESAKSAYVAHRMCSSVVHVGGGMPQLYARSFDQVPSMIDTCAFMVSAWAAPMLESLSSN